MDERKFTDVVASSEKDVDKVLSAARLLRHEGTGNKLNAEQKCNIIGEALFLVGVICGLVFMYLLLTSAK